MNEMIDTNTLENFRNRLMEMETELLNSVEAAGDSTAPVPVDSSIGRLSRVAAIQSQQIALGVRARQQQALLRIRNALEAISNGKYGICRRCKGSISLDRLEAQPDAFFCVECAQACGQ